jgi:hypothetical protein
LRGAVGRREGTPGTFGHFDTGRTQWLQHGCRVMQLQRDAAQLVGRGGRVAHPRKTGLRAHRHHQHHGPGAPRQLERHETPDPVRSHAVNFRFHGVRQQADLHDQLKLAGNTVLVVLM